MSDWVLIKDGSRSKVFIDKTCNGFVIQYKVERIFKNLIKYLPKIAACAYSIPYQIVCVDKFQVKCPGWGQSLEKIILDDEDKEKIKRQIIKQVQQMNQQKICHRDIHAKNICWDGREIRIIDWEYVTSRESSNIATHYDLIGREKNISVPRSTGNMCLLNDHKYSLKSVLLPKTILKIDDFQS